MNLRLSKQRNHALTLMEVLVVVLTLAILASLILLATAWNNAWHKMVRLDCEANLRYIGVAYRVWANDHNGEFPMQMLSTNGNGSDLADGRNAWINYLVMSNELATPKLLHCPEDRQRPMATNFSPGFSNHNISYFIGLDANTNSPRTFLSGDDNFEIGSVSIKFSFLKVTTNTSIAWTTTRHNRHGNIGLADGSTMQTTTLGLQQALQQTGLATNRLALP